MRLLTSLCVFALSAVGAASYTLSGRVIASMQTIPANRVRQLQQDISQGYTKNDILPTSVEFWTETNAGVISGSLMLDFVSSNKAATVWATLTNYSFAPGMSGTISFHMCAIDAANTNGFIPCNSSGAFYLQKTFQ